MSVDLGGQVREARSSRRWTVGELARKAGVSRTIAYEVEAGHCPSFEAGVRLVTALGLRLEVDLVDPRKRVDRPVRTVDIVHSAMGEFEAAHFRPLGFGIGIDEPYQQFHFAGRADLIAWDLDARALLHIENRTRFPDFQDMAGSFNAKREYLGKLVAARAGVKWWASETHVIAALWSAEVLHALRMRPESFRALCPDPTDMFSQWWMGRSPARGKIATLVVLDPLAAGRQRPFIGLEEAIASARPRYRGYADIAMLLSRAQS